MSIDIYDREEDQELSIRSVTRLITDIIVVVVLAMFLVRYVGMTYDVSGHSMKPSFEMGDSVLVNQISTDVSGPGRFDVILFAKEGNEQIYMKRVVGMPGETVQIRGGKLYIDDEILDVSPYMGDINLAGIAASPVVLGKKEYFVIGDNNDSSEDSRYSNVANIKRSEIIGKVWLRYQPFSRFKLIF